MAATGHKELIAQRLNEYLENAKCDHNQKQGIDANTFDKLSDPRIKEQLVQSLADGTVYSILDSLKDLQSLQEFNLWQQREQELEQLKRIDHPDIAEKTREVDQRILERIDQIAYEQQNTLTCAGVPMFKPSEEGADLRAQMAIIRFILSLESIFSHTESSFNQSGQEG